MKKVECYSEPIPKFVWGAVWIFFNGYLHSKHLEEFKIGKNLILLKIMCNKISYNDCHKLSFLIFKKNNHKKSVMIVMIWISKPEHTHFWGESWANTFKIKPWDLSKQTYCRHENFLLFNLKLCFCDKILAHFEVVSNFWATSLFFFRSLHG